VIRDAAAVLADRIGRAPKVAIVLGSGLGSLVDRLEGAVAVPLTALPGLPALGVAGHGGSFVSGRLGGVDVLLQAGRYHVYEGHPLDVVVAPMRIMAALGVDVVVLTSAVGGIRRDLAPGDLVLLEDQVTFTFRSPLTGPVRPGESHFPDMSAPFDPELQALAVSVAGEERIALSRGTYAGVLGPQYETPAEIRMLQRLGCDVVGMSTVPEVIAAMASGVRCVGLSLVTNKAAGLSIERLSHDEVLAAGRSSAARFERLIVALVRRWASESAESGGRQPGSAKWFTGP
jgi:purine-nucleoside phosphorylase